MINDAQVGDPPAMEDDARFGDEPLPAMAAGLESAEPIDAAEKPIAEVVVEDEPAPSEPDAEDSADAKESEPEEESPGVEAQGRAAAEAGEPRQNPYDGRTAAGKAWVKGYDSVHKERVSEE